ncbi:MAG: NAD-dependent epimerase/dehydratase family protein, partial [Bacteroidetes bacterium]|nr:NAD-dependent epimerase/dehydratase family protein [Bacteroidota bacterium]
MSKEKILVIGANGQIGSVLTGALRGVFGEANVVATDIREHGMQEGIFELLDVLDAAAIAEVVNRHHITQIYHLAAILSAKGEANPLKTWDINMNGLFNVFELAREKNVSKVFFPSSIAVFGNDIPRQNTPQNAVLKPTTVYGMSKVAGELWSQYYHQRYGLDVRSVRYPGVIGHQSDPGGGTTDYAVDIYHYGVKGQPYTCFLKENTALPMIYMDDCIRATLELMETPAANLSVRTSYNLAGMSFSPKEIASAIQREVPDF